MEINNCIAMSAAVCPPELGLSEQQGLISIANHSLTSKGGSSMREEQTSISTVIYSFTWKNLLSRLAFLAGCVLVAEFQKV
jgi:hypothetical protein